MFTEVPYSRNCINYNDYECPVNRQVDCVLNGMFSLLKNTSTWLHGLQPTPLLEGNCCAHSFKTNKQNHSNTWDSNISGGERRPSVISCEQWSWPLHWFSCLDAPLLVRVIAQLSPFLSQALCTSLPCCPYPTFILTQVLPCGGTLCFSAAVSLY